MIALAFAAGLAAHSLRLPPLLGSQTATPIWFNAAVVKGRQ